MKTIYCHTINDYTGSTQVLNQIINDQILKTDNKVSVICENSGAGFLSDNPNVDIIEVHHNHLENKNIWCKIKNLFYNTPIWIISLFIKTFRSIDSYDIVYVNTILPFSSVIAARLKGKNVIYHIHEKFKRKSISTRLAEYVFSHVISTRIYVSKYTKEQYVSKINCKEIIKYNRLPDEFTKRIIRIAPKYRLRKNILMICSLNKSKGFYTFINLAKICKHYNFTLILSASDEDIKEEIKCQLPENLTIYPRQRITNDFYKGSDLVLNLSIPEFWTETFGLTIIEAFGYGIPVIAPNYGGPKELIKPNINGLLLDNPQNLNEIIDSIKRIMEDSETYQSYSKNALESGKCFISNQFENLKSEDFLDD